VTAPPAGVVPAAVDEIAIDLAVFDELRLLGGGAEEDFLAELVDLFVHDTEPLLVQVREALEVGDAPAVGRFAHSMKGICGQLGGRRLVLSCDRLEGKAIAGLLAEGQTDLQEVELDYQELRRALTRQLASVNRQRPRSLRA
jgi:histidine phosphotransfer protein HptB